MEAINLKAIVHSLFVLKVLKIAGRRLPPDREREKKRRELIINDTCTLHDRFILITEQRSQRGADSTFCFNASAYLQELSQRARGDTR